MIFNVKNSVIPCSRVLVEKLTVAYIPKKIVWMYRNLLLVWLFTTASTIAGTIRPFYHTF